MNDSVVSHTQFYRNEFCNMRERTPLTYSSLTGEARVD